MKNTLIVKGIGITIGITAVFMLVLSAAHGVGAMFGCGTPEECEAKVAEMNIKAMKKRCEELGKEIALCYAGSKEDCSIVAEKTASFQVTYKELPELACTTTQAPLALGQK